MSVLDRLAHARALDRLGPRPSARPELQRDPSADLAGPRLHLEHDAQHHAQHETRRASGRVDAFERRELAIDLAAERPSTQARGFADPRPGVRAGLLGGCLARVDLPSSSELARDLVCLGAQGAGRAVFIDTETTGLGGVSVPFVIGLAWIEGGERGVGRGARLRFVQWTLSRCGGEAELLADALAQLEALGPAPLVSFNGASFDLPLLRVRARRYGLSARVLDAEHIDLLHPARRMHRGRGRNCRLGTLELDLLGVRRRGDIDSAEIPDVFWAWVQSPNDPRARRRLQAVCDHNLVDLASLPALAAWLGASVREPADLDRALRAARHLEKLGAADQARLVLSRWVEGKAGGERGPRWREAALELARFERRAGDRRRAAQLWRAAWTADPGCPIASEAWAKHLEHHVGDLGEALRVARASRQPCERRITRLEARLRRPGAPASPASAQLEPEPMPESQPASKPARPAVATNELLTRVDQTERGAVVRYRLLR